jgi:hypothetical protein
MVRQVTFVCFRNNDAGRLAVDLSPNASRQPGSGAERKSKAHPLRETFRQTGVILVFSSVGIRPGDQPAYSELSALWTAPRTATSPLGLARGGAGPRQGALSCSLGCPSNFPTQPKAQPPRLASRATSDHRREDFEHRALLTNCLASIAKKLARRSK